MSQHSPRRTASPAAVAPVAGGDRPDAWSVAAGRLWRGALPVVLVGIGVAIVGLLVIRDLLDVPVLRRADGKDLVQATTLWYIVVVVVWTALATGLLHVLLRISPRPFTFYRWIAGLVVVACALVPLTFEASTETRIATALLHLAVGGVVAMLVAGVGRTVAVRPARRPTLV
jgi:hypothetical protein